MGSFDDLIRDVRQFDRRKEVLQQLRKEIRKPIPSVRKLIKTRALTTLPKSGGLNVWVSQTKITAKISFSGRAAGVRLKGGRNSSGGRSDMRRINAGKIRHPSWGRRGVGQWHNQTVAAGFFTKPVTETTEWRDACDRALDEALEVIRRG